MRPVIHHKTGNVYMLIDEIVDATNSAKGKYVILYMNLHGQYFVRDKQEFWMKFSDVDYRNIGIKT